MSILSLGSPMGEISDRVLVTGATGFVGRHFVDRLRSLELKVTAAVRDVERCPAQWRNDPLVSIVETGPLESTSSLADAFYNVGKVVHIAGLAHARNASVAAFSASNESATRKVVNAARDAGVETFVHLSSLAAVSGNASDSVVTDESKSDILSEYGKSKQRAEALVSTLADEGIFAVSLRPPLIVGRNAPGNWRLLQSLAATPLPLPFSSVVNRRSLLGIDHLTHAILWLVQGQWSPQMSGGYCVADPEPLSLPDMVAELRRAGGGRPLLFAFPPGLLKAAAVAAGKARLVASLFESLEVDASPFRGRFGFERPSDIREAIRKSASSTP